VISALIVHELNMTLGYMQNKNKLKNPISETLLDKFQVKIIPKKE